MCWISDLCNIIILFSFETKNSHKLLMRESISYIIKFSWLNVRKGSLSARDIVTCILHYEAHTILLKDSVHCKGYNVW